MRRAPRQALLAFLPLMVGYFALNVPSGLSLYYFANTVITSGQQIWLRKLGGARASGYRVGWHCTHTPLGPMGFLDSPAQLHGLRACQLCGRAGPPSLRRQVICASIFKT